MRRGYVAAALAALALALAACSDGPQPGALVVQLAGVPGARAVKFRLVGPQTGVTAPAGSPVLVASAQLSGDTVMIAAFAPVGDTLNGAVLARLSVSDVRASARYTATVLEVAGPTYALQNPAQYTLTVVRP